MNTVLRLLAGFALLACSLFAGCHSAEDATLQVHRSRFVLPGEPAGGLSIAEARTQLDPQSLVTIVGRIGAVDAEPWEQGKAAFVITEAPAPGHDHAGHDPADCPFCKRRAAQGATPQAMVQFLDERGQLLPIDARQLLGVEKGQIVVVQGYAEPNDLDMLVVSAQGIYVRR